MTETMTQQEALKEAQRRWGKTAFAFEYARDCEVGYYRGSLKPVKFFGDSFEAAFADAERKEKRG
jgi:hypothetical protein